MYRACRSGSALSVLLLLLVCVALLAGCGEPVATMEPTFLEATGSMALTSLVADLASAFHERNPMINLEVSGLGSEIGLEALQAGEADLAMISWLPDRSSANQRAVAIAHDGIAVIAHPTNPVEGLGLLQLQDLFSGRAYEWEAVGGLNSQGRVQPVSREAGSGTRAAFESLVMGDRQVTPMAVLVPSPQAVVEYVAGHPQAIGYVSVGFVKVGVKMLQVEGVLPSPESTGLGSYPLTRDLWLLVDERPSEATQRFLDFVLSPAGQQIVGQQFGRIK